MNKQFKFFGFQAQAKSVIALGLLAIIEFVSAAPSAVAANPKGQVQVQAQKQTSKDQKARTVKPVDHSDLLLVRPNAKVDHVEIADACEQAKGQIIATLGEGAMKVFVVKTEHGRAAQTQQMLQADGHFATVDFDHRN